jgi:DNA-binding MarR family transcriptional regulator
MEPKHVKHDSEHAENLRRSIHAFIRRFGLLEPSRTPCGQPLPVTQAHALMELRNSPGMTHGDLAKRLALAKSTVSRMVARLEAQGRLTQQKDEKDRRIVRLRLTAKGKRLAQKINDRSLERFIGIVERLPGTAFAQVIESIDHLNLATEKMSLMKKEAIDV